MVLVEEDTEGSVRGTRKRKRRKEGKWKRKEVDRMEIDMEQRMKRKAGRPKEALERRNRIEKAARKKFEWQIGWLRKGRKLGGRKEEELEENDEKKACKGVWKDQSLNLKPIAGTLSNDTNPFICKDVEAKPYKINSSAAELTNVEKEMDTTDLSDKPNPQDTLGALVSLKVEETKLTELNTCTSSPAFTWGAEGRLCKFEDTRYGDKFGTSSKQNSGEARLVRKTNVDIILTGGAGTSTEVCTGDEIEDGNLTNTEASPRLDPGGEAPTGQSVKEMVARLENARDGDTKDKDGEKVNGRNVLDKVAKLENISKEDKVRMVLKGKRRGRDKVPSNQLRIFQFLNPIKGLSSVKGENNVFGRGHNKDDMNMDDTTRKRKPSGVLGTPDKKTRREITRKGEM